MLKGPVSDSHPKQLFVKLSKYLLEVCTHAGLYTALAFQMGNKQSFLDCATDSSLSAPGEPVALRPLTLPLLATLPFLQPCRRETKIHHDSN